MRPTHPEEADLLLSKATDFNVNLIQQMAQKRLEYLTKHLGTVAQPGRHAELTGTDPRRSGTQLTRCPEPALGTGRVNRLLPLRGRAALGPFPTGHTSRTQPPGRQSHSRHRWSPRSDPLPSLAKATGFGLFSSRPRARLVVSHLWSRQPATPQAISGPGASYTQKSHFQEDKKCNPTPRNILSVK